MKAIVDLPEAQAKALVELCEREQISQAEAVRRAICEMMESRKKLNRESAFGAWRKREVDSRKLVEDLRSEWS